MSAPNDHPDALLADHAEDTLAPEARAALDAHLAACERCREELALARAARMALSRLPELPAPDGLAWEVRRRASGRPNPRLLRAVGLAAAAAVLVAGGIVAGAQLTGPGEEATLEGAGVEGERPEEEAAGVPQTAAPGDAAGEALARAQAPPPTFSESDRDYRQADLIEVARRLRDDARVALGAGLAPTATEYFRSLDLAAFGPDVRRAVRCVLQEVPPQQLVVPLSIEAASFEGRPAYLTAFLQGPTPDDPYDRIVIWVVDRETCEFLALAGDRRL